MKVHCMLGRIAAVEADPKAELKGVQNAKKWTIDIEYDGTEPAQVAIRLLDWRTGKKIQPFALLDPSYVALSRAAASALVYFPDVGDDKLFVAIEPDAVAAEQSGPVGPVLIRVTVNAIHSAGGP